MRTALQWARRHPIMPAIGFLTLACLGVALRWPVAKPVPIAKAIPIADAIEEAKVEVPDGVEMIFWEEQRWFPPSESRLTIWADGRSEILISRRSAPFGPPLKTGWTVVSESRNPAINHFHRVVQRQDPLSKDEATRKFQTALAAGICYLKTFKVTYNDGGGTLVGIQLNGNLTKTLVPLFSHSGKDQNGIKGSLNHARYFAVKQIMSEFDRDPEEPVGRQQQVR